MKNNKVIKEINKKHSFFELYAETIKIVSDVVLFLLFFLFLFFGCYSLCHLYEVINSYWTMVSNQFYLQLFSNMLTICIWLFVLMISGIVLLYLTHFYLYFGNIKYLPLTKQECEKLNIDNVDTYLLIVNKMIMPFHIPINYHCHEIIKKEIFVFVEENFKGTLLVFNKQSGFKCRPKATKATKATTKLD